jgi:DNA uptake protein ComE-like DNA-binding protein
MHTLRISGLIALLLLMSACTLIQKAAELPIVAVRSIQFGSDHDRTYDPVSLQETLLRFADNFILSASIATESLKRNGVPVEREFMVLAKVRLSSDMIALVTGSNSLNNLISTLIYTKSMRMSIDEYWRPVQFGDSVSAIAKVLDERYRELEEYAAKILTPRQITELRQVIDRWHKTHPSADHNVGELANISTVNQILKVANQTVANDGSYSVFSLLDLDPLASLDPATRELAETRLFGERTLFLTQRLPQLMEWQMELLAYRTGRLPEVTTIVESAAGISKASDRFSLTVADLPGIIHREQEAFMAHLKEQQEGLSQLAKDSAYTFSEGSRMAEAARDVLLTYRSLLDQMDKETKEHPDSPPFNIKDWGESAERVEEMSSSLQQLLGKLATESGAPELQQLGAMTESSAQRIIDYALWRALAFLTAAVFVIAAAVVSSLMIYHRLSSVNTRP